MQERYCIKVHLKCANGKNRKIIACDLPVNIIVEFLQTTGERRDKGREREREKQTKQTKLPFCTEGT